jgi:MerR family copper efflux transcriptional regulator
MREGYFIGELSRRAGIPPQTIRYYEKLGLLERPHRTETQYRLYSETHLERLQFIKQAKQFGLSLEEIKQLIDLRADGVAPCESLKRMVKKHLEDLDSRIRELMAFRQELAHRYQQMDSWNGTGKICAIIETGVCQMESRG